MHSVIITRSIGLVYDKIRCSPSPIGKESLEILYIPARQERMTKFYSATKCQEQQLPMIISCESLQSFNRIKLQHYKTILLRNWSRNLYIYLQPSHFLMGYQQT